MTETTNHHHIGAIVIGAFYDPRVGPDAPSFFDASMTFDDHTTATETVAKFPKSAKVRLGDLSTFDYDIYEATGKYVNIHLPYASTRAVLHANGVNGGKNETGIRRYRTVVASAEKAGIEIVWRDDASNAYPTREAFEKAVAS
jgi:hypothetical protein